MKKEKILIAYFSRRGNNYTSSDIANLIVGNTEVVAKKIQEFTGGNLFEIEPVNSYPTDYRETTVVAEQELQEDARPRIVGLPHNLGSYNYIFLGYPIWWGTFPRPVATFLSENNFAGKTIIPFCTHEGSRLGRSENEIAKLCPKSKILDGIAIRGSEVDDADDKITEWLDRTNKQ